MGEEGGMSAWGGSRYYTACGMIDDYDDEDDDVPTPLIAHFGEIWPVISKKKRKNEIGRGGGRA